MKFAQHLLLLSLLFGLPGYLSARTVVLGPQIPEKASVRLISDSPREVELEFQLGALELDSLTDASGKWATLSAAGMSRMSRSGAPELPQLSVWVYLPGGNAQLEIVEQESLVRRWGIPRPAPEPQTRAMAHEQRRADPEVYRGTGSFPAQPAMLTMSGELQQAPVALVTITPVSYDAQRGDWTVCTRLRIRLTSGNRRSLDQSGPLPRSTRERLARIVINPPDHEENQGEEDPFAPRLLLVTEPEYLPALQPFLDWKRRSGLPTQVIIYSETASSAATLRTYIRAVCDSVTPAPEYLLIVGDVDDIPAFFGIENSLTDHPYSLLSAEDYLPDLAVGRIPCRTAEQCELWVNRLLAYERDAVTAQNYTGTVFAGATQLDPSHGEYIHSLFEDAGMSEVDRLQEPQTGSLTLLMNSLNDSRQWVFYIGHGNAQGWTSVAPDFLASNLSSITAEGAPIVVSVACATADLDYPASSFAEQWLTQAGGRGPLAYFGATEDTPFLRSDTLGIGALRGVFISHAERLGLAADLGRLETAQCFPQPPGGLTEETIQQFVLLGDPSMRLYTVVPESLTVNYPATVPAGTAEISINVSADGLPLSGALLCLRSASAEVYEIAYTDATGSAVLPLGLSVEATLQLTATAYNRIPFQGDVQVVSGSGAALQLADLAVEDTEGDGDGLADRGESGGLRALLVNRGEAAAAGGTIAISCADERVQIGTEAVAFPTVLPGDSIELGSSVPLTVATQIADSDIVLLNIVIAPAGGDTVRTTVPLLLHAPEIIFEASTIVEESGDGDNWPEAGEILRLSVQLRNMGGDDARNLSGLFLQFPEGIQLLESPAVVPRLTPHDVATLSARLSADAAIETGFRLSWTCELSGDNLMPQSGEGALRINRIPAFVYVLDAMPQQLPALTSALTALGLTVEQGTLLPPDLYRYASLWILSGIFPNAVALPEDDAARVAAYLDDGGTCYWEGGDVWSFDPQNALHPYFGIQGVHDGSSDAGPIHGEAGTLLENLHFAYAGENSFIDRLAPVAAAEVLLRNTRAAASYPLCIGFAGETYKTVGSSVELAALTDSLYPATRVHLFEELIGYFGLPTASDRTPPVITHQPVTEMTIGGVPISITADIQDASGLASATIIYYASDGVLRNTPLELGGGLYHAELDGGLVGTSIRYRIRAVDATEAQNAAETPEYTVQIIATPQPLVINPEISSFPRLREQIRAEDGCTWSICGYPETAPALELHGSQGNTIRFTTDAFDCSPFGAVRLSFWHYLRESGRRMSPVARILASTDGGVTFPYVVWECVPGQGILEEGEVQINAIAELAGQTQAVLQFEFSGDWYWRLRNIRVTGTPPPEIVPVRDLVIAIASPGIRLSWGRVPRAVEYRIYGSKSARISDDYELIFRTGDTTFVDLDSRFSARYYAVEAAIEPVLPDAPDPAAVPVRRAQLRLPDLRWNGKAAR